MRRGIRQLAIVSDIHYASPAEAARRATMFAAIRNPFQRWFTAQYRHWFWLRDPFAHNHQLDRFLTATRGLELAVANGDYSCDSAYIGVADDAACASARLCLGPLREQFGTGFLATFGDHEIGKKMLGADEGGLRLASYHRAVRELQLQPAWSREVGRYLLVGVASTLAALPFFAPEALPAERADWGEIHRGHLAEVTRVFERARPDQRILLFCHDPTALPFLASLDAVQRRMPQIERTIIGHLHSPLFIRLSAGLAGMPEIRFLGHTPRRLSAALRRAREWRPFRILLCPSLTGLQCLKDGGFYVAEIDPDAQEPARFHFHPLPW